MSIEITRQDATHTYRISPTDPLLIERRPNKHGALWTFYARRDTPNEARAALLRIGKGQEEEEGK